MQTIGERISIVIKRSGLTKTKFAAQLHLSQQFISSICAGLSRPSDRTIADICREFNVSEAWLRDGVGDIEVKRTINQELAMMVNELMTESDESYRKRFVAALLELPPEFWPELKRFLEKLAER
ncbi:MAG: helix-turn-helix domain-containing protein [Oscillospiraceae bacterium]